MTNNGTVDIQDFSLPPQRNRFVIDGEEFEAAPQLPAKKAMECIHIAERWEQADPAQAAELFRELFQRVLLPDSYERFVGRLDDLERPISLQQLPKIMEWLFERYGMRPTEPSSGSSDGSGNPDDGMNSPGGSPSPVAISTGSPSTAP
jgi:hypothetical protein